MERASEGLPHHPSSDAARTKVLNSLIAEQAKPRPAVKVLDLQGYLASLPAGEMDPHLRPDGVHFTKDGATEVATAWLGPAIVKAGSA
jgi:hypothetical protein